MKKLLYLVFAIFVVAFISCGQKSNKQQVTAHAPVHKIQDTFFGLKLGEATYDDAAKVFQERRFVGETQDRDSNQYAIRIYGPIAFGGVNWENVIFIFSSENVFKSILFQIPQDSEHYTDEDKDNLFSSLHEQLSKKYELTYFPADSTSGENYKASDSKCEMELLRDGILLLGYGLINDPINKGYDSNL